MCPCRTRSAAGRACLRRYRTRAARCRQARARWPSFLSAATGHLERAPPRCAARPLATASSPVRPTCWLGHMEQFQRFSKEQGNIISHIFFARSQCKLERTSPLRCEAPAVASAPGQDVCFQGAGRSWVQGVFPAVRYSCHRCCGFHSLENNKFLTVLHLAGVWS